MQRNIPGGHELANTRFENISQFSVSDKYLAVHDCMFFFFCPLLLDLEGKHFCEFLHTFPTRSERRLQIVMRGQ